jgi:hypothetical protein
MRDLAAKLGVPLSHAVGIMEMLWHYAGIETPQGDIGTAKDIEIAVAVDWSKKPSILIEALIETGWLDRDEKYRLIVHDWPDHAEQAVKKWLERNRKEFLPVYAQMSGNSSRQTSGQNTDTRPPSREARLGEEDVCTNNEKLTNGNRAAKFDAGFLELRAAVAEAGISWSDADWRQAYSKCWNNLALEERIAAVNGIRDRIGTGDFVLKAKPENYLANHLWERSLPSEGRQISATEREFYRMKRDREAQS